MRTWNIRLVDPSRAVVAEARVADEGDHYGGEIDLRRTPPEARALFEEFEEIVNGQMLSFLDEIQNRIARLGIQAVFDDGTAILIRDLQVYPGTGDVSFRLADQTSEITPR